VVVQKIEASPTSEKGLSPLLTVWHRYVTDAPYSKSSLSVPLCSPLAISGGGKHGIAGEGRGEMVEGRKKKRERT